MDIHDKLSEGAAKIVPLGMDEFMAGSDLDSLQHQESIHISEGMKVKQLTAVKLEEKPTNNESNSTLPKIKSESLDEQQPNNIQEPLPGISNPGMRVSTKEEPRANPGLGGVITAPDISGLTFTIQYNLPQAPEPQEQPVIKTEDKPVIKLENPAVQSDLDLGTQPIFPTVPDTPPVTNIVKQISQIKPIIPPTDPLAKDLSKDTFILTTAAALR